MDKRRMNVVKNIAQRNVSEDFDSRKNLDMFGVESLTQKSQLLKFGGRKVAVGETIVLKMKIKNVLFVSFFYFFHVLKIKSDRNRKFSCRNIFAYYLI